MDPVQSAYHSALSHLERKNKNIWQPLHNPTLNIRDIPHVKTDVTFEYRIIFFEMLMKL